jgi:heat shock protein HslJ
MRVRLVVLAALVICLLALSACANPFFGILGGSSGGASVSSSDSRLRGSSWVLARLHADGKNLNLIPTAPVTLQFQQGDATYLGSSGCNYYSGAYIVSGDRLTFKFKGVTQAACVGPIMSQEVTYLNTMQQVRIYDLSRHILTLKDVNGNVILAFSAA